MPTITATCPVLAAADPAAAVTWYCEKLGFSLNGVYGDYAIVERDGHQLHFWKCAERHIAENTSTCIRTYEIDALHASLVDSASGARISPVTDRAWGMREFYVWDPDGNLLRFGQRIEIASLAAE
jgi:catechol 2,3-dioxygenase-like lactoylglutathione lyase family enzyme